MMNNTSTMYSPQSCVQTWWQLMQTHMFERFMYWKWRELSGDKVSSFVLVYQYGSSIRHWPCNFLSSADVAVLHYGTLEKKMGLGIALGPLGEHEKSKYEMMIFYELSE
ncbi:hypothetical protein VNO77_33507 [Canavalia gladiata]|uniref:Uncharacterized protein n=1 Tax=Canavalia gladiata TaxID=3824 RepID=A0AAN9PWF6_CANGL